MNQPQILVLKEGTENTQGKQQVLDPFLPFDENVLPWNLKVPWLNLPLTRLLVNPSGHFQHQCLPSDCRRHQDHPRSSRDGQVDGGRKGRGDHLE
jgi:hypothetical protein